MSRGLDQKASKFVKQVNELEDLERRANKVVIDLETNKDAKIREMEEIKEQAKSELKRLL